MSDLELPGMDQVERVELPFSRQQPKYRLHLQYRVTGYAHFSTWDDPDNYQDDDAVQDAFAEEVVEALDSEVEYDSSWYSELEVQQEDGSWKPVDAETYERIREHQERAS